MPDQVKKEPTELLFSKITKQNCIMQQHELGENWDPIQSDVDLLFDWQIT